MKEMALRKYREAVATNQKQSASLNERNGPSENIEKLWQQIKNKVRP